MWMNRRASTAPCSTTKKYSGLVHFSDLPNTFLAYQIVYLNLIVDRYADYRVLETTPINRLQIYRSIELRTDSIVDQQHQTLEWSSLLSSSSGREDSLEVLYRLAQVLSSILSSSSISLSSTQQLVVRLAASSQAPSSEPPSSQPPSSEPPRSQAPSSQAASSVVHRC